MLSEIGVKRCITFNKVIADGTPDDKYALPISGPDSEKCELVTPILHYEDIESLQELIRRLRKAGAKSDYTRGCGVHIHIGAAGHTPQSLRNLANLMASHETLIAEAIKVDSSRMNRYCRTVNPNFLQQLNKKKPTTMAQLADIWYGAQGWIDGHYFINDARYSIDLTSYQDESLPRYVAIGILLDVGESVRSVSLEITPGTPAENPSLPSLPSDENKTRLLMYAVRLNPGATELTERDWYDYREDKNVCGYCKCILGKCKVTELMSQMAQLVAEVQENNETIRFARFRRLCGVCPAAPM